MGSMNQEYAAPCRQPIAVLADFRSLSLALRPTRGPGYGFLPGRRESGCKYHQDLRSLVSDAG